MVRAGNSDAKIFEASRVLGVLQFWANGKGGSRVLYWNCDTSMRKSWMLNNLNKLLSESDLSTLIHTPK